MKTMMPRMLPALVLATLAFAPGMAAQQTPEQVVQAYYAALRDGDVTQVAALTHPQALEGYRELMIDLLVAAGTGEKEKDPNMPFTLAEARSLPADSIYKVFMAGVGEAMGTEVLQPLLADLDVEVLGQAPRGDSLMYVVYAASSTLLAATDPQTLVITLRRDGQEWRVDPGQGVMNMMGAGVFSLVMGAVMQETMDEVLLEKN